MTKEKLEEAHIAHDNLRRGERLINQLETSNNVADIVLLLDANNTFFDLLGLPEFSNLKESVITSVKQRVEEFRKEFESI